MAKIDDYDFGTISIDGKVYRNDIIILPDKVISWWRKEGHFLHIDDLGQALEPRPEEVVIGTGYSGLMKVPDEVIGELQKSGITVHVGRTREAVDYYNKVSSTKKVVAALHLTC